MARNIHYTYRKINIWITVHYQDFYLQNRVLRVFLHPYCPLPRGETVIYTRNQTMPNIAFSPSFFLSPGVRITRRFGDYILYFWYQTVPLVLISAVTPRFYPCCTNLRDKLRKPPRCIHYIDDHTSISNTCAPDNELLWPGWSNACSHNNFLRIQCFTSKCLHGRSDVQCLVLKTSCAPKNYIRGQLYVITQMTSSTTYSGKAVHN